jgi:mono/diheme cytochrome c family protein
MSHKRKGRRKIKRGRRGSWWQKIPVWVWITSLGVGLIVVGLSIGNGTNNGRSTSTIDPTSLELVAQGEVIFSETCAACHGINGEGDVGPALNGSAHAWHHVDDQLRSVVRDGIPNTAMAGHGEHLTVQEIDAVLSFIKTWWTPEQREMQRTGNHPMG